MQINKFGSLFTRYTKIYSKWIKDLNVKSKNYKTVKRKHRNILHDFELGNDFFDMTTQSKSNKIKK